MSPRGEAAAAPLALWGALTFLIVTNAVTLVALSAASVRHDRLQTDCAAELRERELLLRTASAEADQTDRTIEACHNMSQHAAVLGSTWLTVAAEARRLPDAKAQLRGVLSSLLFEAPRRSLPGAELRLYNVHGSDASADGTSSALGELEKLPGLESWREHGRLSTFLPMSVPAGEAAAPEGSITGAGRPDASAEERTLNFASMVRQLHGSCQHVLFLELGSGAQLCPAALHIMRNSISRADSFWGAWTAVRFSHGVDGLVMPCSHLASLADFLQQMRKAAILPHLLEVWLSKDVAKFPVLKRFEDKMPAGSALISRANLVMFQDKAMCGAPFQLQGAISDQKGFDDKTCGHTDLSPCHADVGEPWLRYQVPCSHCKFPPLSFRFLLSDVCLSIGRGHVGGGACKGGW